MSNDVNVFKEAVEDWAILESIGFRDFEILNGLEWRERHQLKDSQKFERMQWTPNREWVHTTGIASEVVCVVIAVELRSLYFEEEEAVGDWGVAIGNQSIRNRKQNLHFLATSFGYAYGLGFDKDDEIMFWPRHDISDVLELPSLRNSRAEQMQHWLWKELRDLVKKRAGWQCKDCGLQTKDLDAHHTYYRWGRLYWQYPPQSLIALCRRCHQQRHMSERKWRLLPAQMRANELHIAGEAIAESISEYCPASSEKDWANRTRFFELLKRFHFPAGIQSHLQQLLAKADSLWQPEPSEGDEEGGYWWKRLS